MRIIQLILCLSIILGNEVAVAYISLGDHEISVFESGEEGEEKDKKENLEEELNKEFLDRESFYVSNSKELVSSNYCLYNKKHLTPFMEIHSPPPDTPFYT